jgi:signal transduction histidine kinase
MLLNKMDIGDHEKNILEYNLKTIIDKIRNLTNQIYPSCIENLGLYQALKMKLRLMQNSNNVQVDLVTSCETFRLSKKEERAIYFILNELVSNCLSHSNCTKIQIELCESEDMFYCSIVDDGEGFELSETDFFRSCQMGLQKVFGRIKGLNGKIAFEKIENSGSRVKIELNYAN